MKGLVFVENNVLSWQEVPETEPKAGEVKLKIMAAGICGSDIHGYRGISGRRQPPMVMGHEFSGVITALGEGVEGWSVGDRVTANPVNYCGECEYCRSGLEQFCPNKRQYGCAHEDGAFEEYLCVDQKCLFRLADSVSFAEGAAIEPLAVAVKAAGRAGELKGRSVFIVGAGTIGLMVLTVVKAFGCGTVIVSDTSDFRLGLAASIGADITVNPKNDDVAARVLDATGGVGADVSFECVGVPATLNQALGVIRLKGTAVIMGQGVQTAEINAMNLCVREPNVLGSFMYNYAEFARAVDMMNNGLVDVKPILSVEAPMSEGAEYFDRLANDPGELIKVILV